MKYSRFINAELKKLLSLKKDMDKANYYFNNSLKELLFIITPLTIFLSIFAKEIWYIFYGQSYYGPIIFKYIILVAILDSAYIIFFSAFMGILYHLGIMEIYKPCSTS